MSSRGLTNRKHDICLNPHAQTMSPPDGQLFLMMKPSERLYLKIRGIRDWFYMFLPRIFTNSANKTFLYLCDSRARFQRSGP
jgi:hypothetical protein